MAITSIPANVRWGRIKVLEPQPWSREPLNTLVVLLNDVIQVFALLDCDARGMLAIHLL